MQSTSIDRQPWKAVVLSLLCTGLGHLYAGAVSRGLALFGISLLVTPLFVVAAHAQPSEAWLWALMAAVAAVVVVYALAVLDSWRQAGRGHAGVPVPPWVYALFIVVGLSYPVASAWLIRSAAFQAFVTAANSMVPTLEVGDRFLVNRARPSQGLQHGDIIVHRNPADRREMFVKRLVALPGDTVAVETGGVRVNGLLLPRDAVAQDDSGTTAMIEHHGRVRYSIQWGAGPGALLAPTTVPDGHCFVLGDHRSGSRDSRSFGTVPLGDVIGVAEYLFWPAGSWTRFGALRPAPE